MIGLLGAKQLGLLRELVPNVTVASMLVNPNNPTSKLTDAQAVAGSLGLQIHVLNANTEIDIDQAFASAIQQGVGGPAEPLANGGANVPGGSSVSKMNQLSHSALCEYNNMLDTTSCGCR